MNLADAIGNLNQILDEERTHPTVNYGTNTPISSIAAAGSFGERGKHPRTIQEQPQNFVFKSTNFDLLCTLLDQVGEHDRDPFVAASLSRISERSSYRDRLNEVSGAGQSQRCASELPLVAEFAVRRGSKRAFLKALDDAAISPGLTLLLLGLEEMIALNFTIFAKEEYEDVAGAIKRVGQRIEALSKQPKPSSTVESNTRYHVCEECKILCESVSDGCRKARYLYLKGALLPESNVEINQDKAAVRTFLEKLGFESQLIQSLDEAERLYRNPANPFELKSSLGHLRSFLETLHIRGCARIQTEPGGKLPVTWGGALRYLSVNKVLTKYEEEFAAKFYTLMSDVGVHPLVAEREYARLMRNMSIEYGLLFLTKLDKQGID